MREVVLRDTGHREEEERELAAVLASPAFVRSARIEALLSYLCAKYFAGESDSVKEYNIGVEALGRRDTFDPATDSIARVEVHRLRRKLREYYEGEGADHAVHIEIPVGSYVPVFVRPGRARKSVELDSSHRASPAGEVASRDFPAPINREVEPQRTRPLNRTALYAALAVGLAGAGFVALKGIEHARADASVKTGLANAGATALPIVPVPGDEIRILCGETKAHIDKAGRHWSPDRFFNGGGVVARPRQYLARTYDFNLYAHSRFGNFSYVIPLKPGNYELHLYFAETSYGPGMSLGGGETSRLFNVEVNGRPLLVAFDILADAAGPGIADERVFTDIAPDSDGMLHLKFIGLRDNATVDAIALMPAPPHRINPVRLSAQDNSYTDSKGRVWGPDNYWAGGQKPFRVSPVRDTPDPDLYGTEHYGNFTYAIPVAPGAYDVNVHMAETYWGKENAGGSGEGQRIFDIFCNGAALARHVDIVKQAGPNRALVLHYSGLRPNSQGKLNLSFVPVTNYASMCALEIINSGE